MIPILDSILSITNKFIPDINQQQKLKAQIIKGYEDGLKSAVSADKDIKLAEMRQGGIASIWRPVAAISIFLTLFLHWFIIPVMHMIVVIGDYDVYLPQLELLPVEYYGLALAFVSIYAYGRSREKEAFNFRLGK